MLNCVENYLTPDGMQRGIAAWAKEPDNCCPSVHCIDPCEISCNLIWALPSGPMWDAQKAKSIEALVSKKTTGSVAPCYSGSSGYQNPYPSSSPCPPVIGADGVVYDGCGASETQVYCDSDKFCATLADYAIFMGNFVSQLIDRALWQTRREGNPFTAITTLDDWLQRFGYDNCYKTIRATTANVQVGCNSQFCDDIVPTTTNLAVQSGLVKALNRFRIGGIDNVDYLNWLIEPLGAVLLPDNAASGDVCEDLCARASFKLCLIDGMIDAPPAEHCYDARSPSRIPAGVDQSAVKKEGQPDIVWPNLVAAQCFLQAYFENSFTQLTFCDTRPFEACVVTALTTGPAAKERCQPAETYASLCGLESLTENDECRPGSSVSQTSK